MTETAETIREYIVERMLDGDGRDLTDQTDLLESRVLDSFSVLELTSFLNRTYRISIAPADITPANLRTIEALSRLVSRYRQDAAG